jgi:hypothetical protein
MLLDDKLSSSKVISLTGLFIGESGHLYKTASQMVPEVAINGR